MAKKKLKMTKSAIASRKYYKKNRAKILAKAKKRRKK